MKHVLLTGAGGFVGSHCLEHLLIETDWRVVCLDSFRHRGKTSRIREVLDGRPDAAGRVTVLTHDLRAPIDSQLDQEIGPVNLLVSIASDSHVDRSIVEPRSFIENNTALVLTLLEWTRQRARLGPDGIQKFLHLSTDEVYGPAPTGHDHAEGDPHRPSNPYSASKSAQEQIIYSYWRTYGLPLGVVNSMNLVGERQDPEKFVPLVLSKVLRGEDVEIHAAKPEHGSVDWQPGSRFYLHARNLADGLLFLLKQSHTCQRYDRLNEMDRWNVVGEREVDNLEMAQMIVGFAGQPLAAKFVDFHSQRPGHDLRYALDGSKMRDLGWTPPLPLAESLEQTVHWTMQNPRWLLDDARILA